MPTFYGIFISEGWCQLNAVKYVFNNHILCAQQCENIKKDKLMFLPLRPSQSFSWNLTSERNYPHT